jgi:hypothetical protein
VTRGLLVVVLTVGPGVLFGSMAWNACGSYGERCTEAGRDFPGYDPLTGQVAFVARDIDGNGIAETWVHRTGAGIGLIEMDDNEDGTIDRWVVFDGEGRPRLATGPLTAEPSRATEGTPVTP